MSNESLLKKTFKTLKSQSEGVWSVGRIVSTAWDWILHALSITLKCFRWSAVNVCSLWSVCMKLLKITSPLTQCLSTNWLLCAFFTFNRLTCRYQTPITSGHMSALYYGRNERITAQILAWLTAHLMVLTEAVSKTPWRRGEDSACR